MHSFICGQSGSGKTHLAKQLSHAYKAAGRGVLVCDPNMDSDWSADKQFSEIGPFVEFAKRATGCALFVEECLETVGMHPPPEVKWIATRSRHWGHLAFFSSHRGAGVNLSMRMQCSRLFLFNVEPGEAAEWAKIYNDPELLKAADLPAHEFYYKERFKRCQRMKLTK